MQALIYIDHIISLIITCDLATIFNLISVFIFKIEIAFTQTVEHANPKRVPLIT